MPEIDGYIEWKKERPDDKVWWGTIFHGISENDIKSGRVTNEDINDSIGWGDHIFSFDKHKIYWLFRDYPDSLTSEEREIFDREKSILEKIFSKIKTQKIPLRPPRSKPTKEFLLTNSHSSHNI